MREAGCGDKGRISGDVGGRGNKFHVPKGKRLAVPIEKGDIIGAKEEGEVFV